MGILRHAAECVQRNLSLFGLYVLLIAGSRSLVLLADWSVGALGAERPLNDFLVYTLVANVVLLFITALAQTIVFAKLGAAVDCPLWKLSGMREALRRYFPLWLVFNAIALALNFMIILLEGAAGVLQLLFMVIAIGYIPVGACIMFYRAFSWAELGRVLRPLLREGPKAFVIFTFSGICFFGYFTFLIQVQHQPYLQPLVEIIFAYTDLLVFCASWLICMIDRESPEEDVEF